MSALHASGWALFGAVVAMGLREAIALCRAALAVRRADIDRALAAANQAEHHSRMALSASTESAAKLAGVERDVEVLKIHQGMQ